jgi:DNA-binding response OmpR family regulator
MGISNFTIFFVDNAVHKIFKTIESLKEEHPTITVFNSEQDLFSELENLEPDLIFLNLDLQPNDGVALAKEIQLRKLSSNPFIVLYSLKQDDFVQELAFNSGIDSFINFQQKSAVMKLFVRNLLRRRKQNAQVTDKKVIIDCDKYLIFKEGEPFQLPRKEFRLFELLYANSDKFFSKPEIASIIWEDPAVANKRTIDVHIYNIRQLFGKRIIQSQKGKGYRMNKKVID